MSVDVSIIIPSYEREAYLKQSVSSALQQTYKNLEVLVCDNSSQSFDVHQSLEEFNSSKLKIFRHDRNIGFIKNWNFGLSQSQGKFIKILGDDDILLEDAVLNEVKTLEQNSSCGMVCTNYITIDQNGNELNTSTFNRNSFRIFNHSTSEEGHQFIVNYFLGNRRVGMPSAILFRKELATEVGGVDIHSGCPADIDLWLRILRHSNFYYLDEIHMKMRRHPGNLSNSITVVKDDIRVLKKHLDEVRKQPIGTQAKIYYRYFRILAAASKNSIRRKR